MIKEILVVGAGSAGLLAALGIARKMPQVKLRIVRSPDIGIVGVGESTTPNVRTYLFDYLGIDRRSFFQMAEPTWKLGIHFLWGPRSSYVYPFVWQLDARLEALPRPTGYYCYDDFSGTSVHSALMCEGKAFPRGKNGMPEMDSGHAFHLENAKFVKALELAAQGLGIEFIDGNISAVEKNDGRLSTGGLSTGGLSAGDISAVVLEDGRRLAADFFIDASGFRSELLGKALQEPFISFEKSLFNDRAILGSWARGADEPILPYTTAETMNAGWSWRIDHEHIINRGYVYCSHNLTEEEARREFAAKNPKAKLNDRLVRFRTGRYERSWVGNVMAIGNSFGFVEPLEATALMLICWQCQSFIDMVQHAGPTARIRDLFNKLCSMHWDETRDFLTLHFVTNTRIDTPYWRRCREEADATRLQDVLEFYYDTGPSGFMRYCMANPESHFGVEGYLVQLIGNKVPHRNPHIPSDAELQLFERYRTANRVAAKQGFTVAECLAFIRHPNWRWFSEQRNTAQPNAAQPNMAK